MSRLIVREHDSKYSLIKGPLRDWLRDNGIPATYSAKDRGWLIRNERVADVVALAQHDRFAVTVGGVR